MIARTIEQHLDRRVVPKRILALDGGGVRGALTLAYLARLEASLRERLGADHNFRLSDWFDLIAGTSTGAIIAAGLAKGMEVRALQEKYRMLGQRVFKRGLLRDGVVFRAKYDVGRLTKELRATFGSDATLGSSTLRTGLLVVTKRLDTESTWPLTNNPEGKYFAGDGEGIANRDYPLWRVVRASSAAPTYFDPESFEIAHAQEGQATRGLFVDGGVSPHNNPALQAFMVATLDGFRLRWQTGSDVLLIVSLGTGRRDVTRMPGRGTAIHALRSLLSLMNDCEALVETLMQWMSESPTARVIDGEVGALERDLLAGKPQFHYLRYDVSLSRNGILPYLAEPIPEAQLQRLSAIDDPDNIPLLERLGAAAAERDMLTEHIPTSML